MMGKRLAIVIGLGALAAVAYTARQQLAAVPMATNEDPGAPLDLPSIVDPWLAAVNPFADTPEQQATEIETAMEQAQTAPDRNNIAAFLSMIGKSEGTDRADPYRICYGYKHTIADLSDHPAVTGEWRGEDISGLGAQYRGQVSTAAGRYQIIKRTWLGCKSALGLPDFSPESQDAAAVYLIKGRGALDDVLAGRFATAVRKCAKEWASLPGAGYDQPERKLAYLETAYLDAGGFLA